MGAAFRGNFGASTMGLALVLGTCGAAVAGQDSPWQKWMKDTVVPAKAAGDWKRLEELNVKMAAANPAPAAFPRWKEFCDQGVAASRKADKDALNRSCTACHNEYRKLFREQYRSAPLPK